MKIMIRTWKLANNLIDEIHFVDMTSLDAITRQLPEGYYSTFRTFDGCTRVLGLTTHLRRLYDPVGTPEVSDLSLRRQLRVLLEPYHPDEARVRAIMTKQGEAYIAIEPLKKLPSEIYEKGVRVEPLKKLPSEIYEKGVRVETIEMQRETPRLKSTAFISASDSERKHIAQEGIFEALLVKNGKILEGMTSNFFYVKYLRAERSDEYSPRSVDEAQALPQLRASSTGFDDFASQPSAQREAILYTARDDILLGITRKTVIDLARGRGLEVKYELLKRNQLAAVEEAFITSSSRGIVPVVQIDDVMIGQGRPGLITKELASAYEAYVIEKAARI